MTSSTATRVPIIHHLEWDTIFSFLVGTMLCWMRLVAVTTKESAVDRPKAKAARPRTQAMAGAAFTASMLIRFSADTESRPGKA